MVWAAWAARSRWRRFFAIEAGLGDQVGGITLSLANGMLFATPLMLRWMQRNSIRAAVRLGFLAAGLLFAGAVARQPEDRSPRRLLLGRLLGS